MRKDKFNIILEYPLSCFPQGGNDSSFIGTSNVNEIKRSSEKYTAKQSLDANAAIKDKAKMLRRKMTEAEKILWSRIRNRKVNGMYFRRQHPYGNYILDFFCFEANLAIEVDGLIHLSKHEYDLERTKHLESSGLTIIRFRNTDIENRIGWVLEKIQEVVDPFPLGGNKKGGNSIKGHSPNLVILT